MEAEDEAGATLDPIHAGSMRGSTIGLNVGTTSRVQIIDQIDMLVVAAEVAIKIGVVAEVLAAPIISIIMVVGIFKIITRTTIRDQSNNISREKATIMIRVDHP